MPPGVMRSETLRSPCAHFPRSARDASGLQSLAVTLQVICAA